MIYFPSCFRNVVEIRYIQILKASNSFSTLDVSNVLTCLDFQSSQF